MLEFLTYFPWWCYPLMIIGVFIVLFTFIAITDIDVIGHYRSLEEARNYVPVIRDIIIIDERIIKNRTVCYEV